jgi:hypothetical protein
MSGKIKSTIELAMEKAAKLPRLTEEELRQQQEKEYGPRGRVIGGRFLAGDLAAQELDAELSRYQGEQGEIVRGAFLASMCQAIDIGETEATARGFEGIKTLVRDDHLEETSSRLSGILRDYEEQRQREFAKTEQAEAVNLRELGVSGSAIRLNMEQSEGWREKRSELLAEFRPKLDDLKRELSDHLRRVISDDQG